MIVFDLACAQGHRFEGWFASGEEFARQSEARLVHCPVCEDAEVVRLPSAKVRVGASSDEREVATTPEPATSAVQEMIAGFHRAREGVRPSAARERRRRFTFTMRKRRRGRSRPGVEESAAGEEGIEFSSLPISWSATH
jgi:hypothetical protein